MTLPASVCLSFRHVFYACRVNPSVLAGVTTKTGMGNVNMRYEMNPPERFLVRRVFVKTKEHFEIKISMLLLFTSPCRLCRQGSFLTLSLPFYFITIPHSRGSRRLKNYLKEQNTGTNDSVFRHKLCNSVPFRQQNN